MQQAAEGDASPCTSGGGGEQQLHGARPQLCPWCLQAGIASDSGHCWALSRGRLFIWNYRESRDTRLRSLRLPWPSSPGETHFVSILAQQGSNATKVVLCSSSGMLAVWFDISYLAEPVTHQVLSAQAGQAVVSFSATEPQLAAGPGFAAALVSSDGSVYTVQGSQMVSKARGRCIVTAWGRLQHWVPMPGVAL